MRIHARVLRADKNLLRFTPGYVLVKGTEYQCDGFYYSVDPIHMDKGPLYFVYIKPPPPRELVKEANVLLDIIPPVQGVDGLWYHPVRGLRALGTFKFEE